MVKLKNPLFSLDAGGTIGKAISFVKRRGQNIAEKKPEILDAKTTLQLNWRHMFDKCTALWHDLSAVEQAEWESVARPKHMTGYAYWQSQCLRPNPGIYLPLQGGTMSGDIDMAKHHILKLPAPVDLQEAVTLAYHNVAANLPTHGATRHTDVTRHLFIPATEGHTIGTRNSTLDYATVKYVDGANLWTWLTFEVPDDFVSYTSLKAVWLCPAAAGNMYWGVRAIYAADGEVFNIHYEGQTSGPTATGGANIKNTQEPNTPVAFTNLALGDTVGLGFYRASSLPADTLNADVYFFGFRFTYVASQ